MIILVLGLLVLGQSSPTLSRAQNQQLNSFLHNQIRATEEAIDVRKLINDIASSVWSGDRSGLENPVDILRRFSGIITKIDEDPEQHGGKDLADRFYIKLANLIDKHLADSGGVSSH